MPKVASLSILCVTRGEEYALPFLRHLEGVGFSLRAEVIFAVDGGATLSPLYPQTQCVSVKSVGYLESVLDDALKHCTGTYVLRVDDDETISPAMFRWLEKLEYLGSNHWKFPRAHLWGDRSKYIVEPPLWPDHQTRLSIRTMSGGRRTVHAGSPHGGGTLAPVVLEHHKFLVKTIEERRAIAARYDAVQLGYGTGGMMPFNVPEDVWENPRVELTVMADYAAAQDAVAVEVPR